MILQTELTLQATKLNFGNSAQAMPVTVLKKYILSSSPASRKLLGPYKHVFLTVVWVIPSNKMGSFFQVFLMISSTLFDLDFQGKEARCFFGCLLRSISSSTVLLAAQQIVSLVPNKFQLCNNFPHAFRCYKTALSPFCVLGLSYFLVSFLLLIKSNGVINVYFTQYTSLYMYIAASNGAAISCCMQALYSLLL